MVPTANGYSVRAPCPDCGGALSNWDYSDARGEFGFVLVQAPHTFANSPYARVHYRMLRCAGCGRAGLAKFHDNGGLPASLEWFFPRSLQTAALPTGVPESIVREYREAELCASADAWRGASALLRSVLEKTLKANGYVAGSLENKIDEAAADGVITKARSQKAHEDIRVLGNEVVHDEWRLVEQGEVVSALHYAQRVLEDLYDDRSTVEGMLRGKGRIK